MSREKAAKREAFLMSSDRESRQLGIKELRQFVTHYQEKLGIRIIVNGDTLKIPNPEAPERIALLLNKTTRYYAYLSKWRSSIMSTKGMEHLEITPFPGSGKESNTLFEILQTIIPQQFLSDGDIRDDLNETELEEFNRIIDENEEAKRGLHSHIHRELHILSLHKPPLKYAVTEIKTICMSLNRDEQVGYVYTGQVHSDEDHFQSLILRNDCVICPTFMPMVDRINSSYFPTTTSHPIYFYTSPAFALQGKNRSAQSDMISCGTLGILYLKTLLKNSGELLSRDSLKFLCANSDGLRGVFIPPASVLQYSQSRAFNEALFRMVNDEGDDFKLEIPGKGTITHKTLAGALKESIITANKKGDTKTAEDNTRILSVLPEFRTRWIEAARTALDKNATMQTESGNLRLAYKNRRLLEKTGLFSEGASIKKEDDSRPKNSPSPYKTR